MKKIRKYNLHLEVYPVEYVELSQGYEPVLGAKPLIRYNFILSDDLHKDYIKHQIKNFVKDLDNGTADYAEPEDGHE